MILLVKNKSGDMSDISPTLSKLFEVTLESYIKNDNNNENHQFGFKAGHSTGLCTMDHIGQVRVGVGVSVGIVECRLNCTRYRSINITIMPKKTLKKSGKQSRGRGCGREKKCKEDLSSPTLSSSRSPFDGDDARSNASRASLVASLA